MAIALQTVGTASQTNGSAPTPGLPTGLTDGDVMIAAFFSRESVDGTVSLPAAWTPILNDRSSGGLLAAWWRVWQSGDAAPTFTLGGHATGTSGDSAVAQIARFSGCNTSAPIGTIGSISTNASAQNIGTIAGITADGGVIVLAGKKDDWTSVATLSGESLSWSEIGEPDGTQGADCGMVWDFAAIASSTAIAAKTFTVTGGAAAVGKGIMFELKTAPIAGVLLATLDTILIAATGILPIVAALGVTLASVELSAAGSLPIVSSVTATFDDATLSASGTISDAGVVGVLTVSLDDVSVSAQSVLPVVGILSLSLNDVSFSSFGALNVVGTAALALDDASLSGVSRLPLAGISSPTLDDIGLSASGAVSAVGAVSISIDDAGLVSTGELPIVGSLSVGLDGTGLSASGGFSETITGELSFTFDGIIVAAFGVQYVPAPAPAPIKTTSSHISDMTFTLVYGSATGRMYHSSNSGGDIRVSTSESTITFYGQ